MNTFTIAAIAIALLMIFTGLYLLLKTHNMLRIIIAIEIVMKAITLLIIFAGMVNGKLALSQSFVITVIVVEVVVAVVAGEFDVTPPLEPKIKLDIALSLKIRLCNL